MARGKYERIPEPKRKPATRNPEEREAPRGRVSTRPPMAEAAEPWQEPAPQEQPAEKRTVFTVVRDVLVGLIAAFAVCTMIFTVISVTTLDRSERTFLGYKAFIVLSDSMKATDFESGDVVLVKPVNPATLQPGDIIAFTSRNSGSSGETMTHKIRSVITDEDGEPAFVTYGTTTGADDETTVSYSAVLGKYVGKLPKIGYFFQFLRTGPGYILFIFVPFGLVILYHGIRSVHLFQQEKREERKQMEDERAQMAAEREETRRLLAELKRMQAQNNQSQSQS